MPTATHERRAIRYAAALAELPPPGHGHGLHARLLTVANHATRAGVQIDRAFTDIRDAIPEGTRPVRDGEIRDALSKAYGDARNDWRPTPQAPPRKIDTGAAIVKATAALTRRADGRPYEDVLRDLSPVDTEARDPAATLFRHLYAPEDLLIVGDAHTPGKIGESIRTAREWSGHFDRGGDTQPHFCPNPLTGQPAPTKCGTKTTLRGDACVAAHRFAVVEFDGLDLELQAALYLYLQLPIAAIIDSGGKSLHALVRVDAADAATWDRTVRVELFKRTLVPLGADGACANPSRFTRLPGHQREGGRSQRLLFLDPAGGALRDA